jgi:hypothetical protein
MRHLITTLATGILLFGMTAAAQYRFLSPDSDRQDQLFEHLRADLSIANTVATPLTGDLSRIERAVEALNSLQYQVDRGDYNLRQFDQAIRAVQEVMRQNATLPNRTLDNLSDDLGQLRVLETRSPDWRQSDWRQEGASIQRLIGMLDGYRKGEGRLSTIPRLLFVCCERQYHVERLR